MRIGVFLPSWVGDACMATPALKAIRRGFSDATLVGIAQPVVHQVLDGDDKQNNLIQEWTLFRKKWWGGTPVINSRLGLVGAIRRSSLDCIVLFTNSLWSAAVARTAGVPSLIGYRRDGRGLLLTHGPQPQRTGRRYDVVSAVDYYLELARWLGCETRDRRMQLAVDERSRQEADALWAKLGLQRDVRTIVINSNAATQTARVWPANKVQQLAEQLVRRLDCQVLLHCGPQERQAANQVAKSAGNDRIVSMGEVADLPIGLSKAVLSRADVVVSTDSGARHMAVALDRPVVSLFGPTDAAWTRTHNVPETTLAVEIACRSCYQRECPLGHHQCMQNISVDRVLHAVEQKLLPHSNRQAA